MRKELRIQIFQVITAVLLRVVRSVVAGVRKRGDTLIRNTGRLVAHGTMSVVGLQPKNTQTRTQLASDLYSSFFEVPDAP